MTYYQRNIHKVYYVDKELCVWSYCISILEDPYSISVDSRVLHMQIFQERSGFGSLHSILLRSDPTKVVASQWWIWKTMSRKGRKTTQNIFIKFKTEITIYVWYHDGYIDRESQQIPNSLINEFRLIEKVIIKHGSLSTFLSILQNSDWSHTGSIQHLMCSSNSQSENLVLVKEVTLT